MKLGVLRPTSRWVTSDCGSQCRYSIGSSIVSEVLRVVAIDVVDHRGEACSTCRFPAVPSRARARGSARSVAGRRAASRAARTTGSGSAECGTRRRRPSFARRCCTAPRTTPGLRTRSRRPLNWSKRARMSASMISVQHHLVDRSVISSLRIGVMEPLMRTMGGAPVVMWRSEAPWSFTSLRIAPMRTMATCPRRGAVRSCRSERGVPAVGSSPLCLSEQKPGGSPPVKTAGGGGRRARRLNNRSVWTDNGPECRRAARRRRLERGRSLPASARSREYTCGGAVGRVHPRAAIAVRTIAQPGSRADDGFLLARSAGPVPLKAPETLLERLNTPDRVLPFQRHARTTAVVLISQRLEGWNGWRPGGHASTRDWICPPTFAVTRAKSACEFASGAATRSRTAARGAARAGEPRLGSPEQARTTSSRW